MYFYPARWTLDIPQQSFTHQQTFQRLVTVTDSSLKCIFLILTFQNWAKENIIWFSFHVTLVDIKNQYRHFTQDKTIGPWLLSLYWFAAILDFFCTSMYTSLGILHTWKSFFLCRINQCSAVKFKIVSLIL